MPSVISAQVLTPAVTFSGQRPPSLGATPAEALVNLDFEARRTEQYAVSLTQVTHVHYPRDSMLALSATRAQAWIAKLDATSVEGLQVDPYAMIAVMAHQTRKAQQQIATRLAMPNLSLADRAYTLEIAVAAFASSENLEQLSIAEQYLAQLDALGREAAFWQFRARKPMIYAYYRLGESQEVARTGMKAFELVGSIPYELRGGETMYTPAISFYYAAVVDALSGQPNGRARIHAMNAALLAATAAPPALIAHDSIFTYLATVNRHLMQEQVNLAERVGEPGTSLIANYWVNRGASRDSQSVAVDDGKIRVVEIGSFTCAPCMAAVSGLERLHQRYPGVEFNFLTAGTGTWGNRIVPPKVEADHLAEHFVMNLHATFPIGIAMPVWIPADDGGESPTVTTQTWRAGHYPQTGKPTFYVLDGHGVIRRVIGGYNRDFEENLSQILEFLQNEARHS